MILQRKDEILKRECLKNHNIIVYLTINSYNIQIMDDQHPSSEKEKVQRLSHKGVLNDSFIIWETPPNENKIYVYLLSSSLDDKIRYVGITNNPKTRLSHHINNKRKSHKNSWIKSVINRNGNVIMRIIDSFDTYAEALLKEESTISSYELLTNQIQTPTHPGSKKCYILDLKYNEIRGFDSIGSAAININSSSSSLLTNRISNRRYIFSYSKDFEDILLDEATIKIKCPDGKIKYAITYQHAAWIIGCSVNMINLCLLKQRRSVKKHIVCKIEEDFHLYKYRNNKGVICINDNKAFSSIKECARFYNFDESGISKVCKGKRKHYKNMSFKFIDDIVRPL